MKTFNKTMSANMIINLFCNFRCPYCYVDLKKREDKKLIGNPNIQPIINFFNKSNKTWKIYISGGEPFLHPRFLSLCKKLTKRHFIGVNSNLSSPLIYKFADTINPRKVNSFECSFHYYENKRLNLTKEFIKKVKYLESRGFKTNVHVVMWPPVLKEIDNIYNKFKKQNIPIRPEGFRGKYNKKEYPENYTDKEVKIMNFFLKQYQKNNKNPGSMIDNKKYQKELLGSSLCFKEIICRAGKDHIAIDYRGNVKRCHSEDMILGNIFDDNVKILEKPLPCKSKKCNCYYEGIEFAMDSPKISKIRKLSENHFNDGFSIDNIIKKECPKFSIYEQLDILSKSTSISKEEGKFIYRFLKEKNIKKTIEIGLGYGCSSAYIISATKSKHLVIDPFQKENFGNIGLQNIKKIGLDNFLKFIENKSHNALPNLLKQNLKFDFAFIDGDHKFDGIFIDFYYIDLMLNQKGFVLFHDYWMSSTKTVVSWIKNNKKNYKEIKNTPKNMFLFQKVGVDDREWNHYEKF
ncbi:radical SAM protein [Candidatus Pacearchaeota archaeon]|nr:radical SAM protein [Candidatus Pacearchaeota archaeon]